MQVAVREGLGFVEAYMAAFERILEREGLAAAAVADKGPKAEENLVEAPGYQELIAGLELPYRHSSLENLGPAN
jgi:hypothetical protein